MDENIALWCYCYATLSVYRREQRLYNRVDGKFLHSKILIYFWAYEKYLLCYLWSSVSQIKHTTIFMLYVISIIQGFFIIIKMFSDSPLASAQYFHIL